MMNIKNFANKEKQHLDKPMIGRQVRVQMSNSLRGCKNNIKNNNHKNKNQN